MVYQKFQAQQFGTGLIYLIFILFFWHDNALYSIKVCASRRDLNAMKIELSILKPR